jgi:hypothetical protein
MENMIKAIRDPWLANELFQSLSTEVTPSPSKNAHSNRSFRAIQLSIDIPVSPRIDDNVDPPSRMQSEDPSRILHFLNRPAHQRHISFELQIWPVRNDKWDPPSEYKGRKGKELEGRLFDNNLEVGFQGQKGK